MRISAWRMWGRGFRGSSRPSYREVDIRKWLHKTDHSKELEQTELEAMLRVLLLQDS